MSESDQTWNAGESSGEPTDGGATPPAEQSWPQYSWPQADETTTETPTETPAGPTSETPTVPTAATPPPAESVSWPPAQPGSYAAAPGPYAASGPYAAPGPYTAPGPYASGPYTWPPTAPAPVATAPAPNKARRGLAVVAALALVLASAGVGAGVAMAVHNDNSTRTFSATPTPSNNGNSNNGNSNNNGGGFTVPGNGGFTIPGSGNNGSTNGNGNGGTGTLDINSIASKVDPALVNINTTLSQGRAAGTGMLISSTGEILTNNHVIAGATSIKVTIGGIGDTHDAKVVGYDVTEDVALIQITDKVSDLPTVVFGEPSKVQIGDPVVAIGNALGQGGLPKASQGHVTALDQQVTAGDESTQDQETLEGMIQINAPIQPGDSGGALVDAGGKVIGMNTAAAGGGNFNSQQGSSIGFAIPIDNAVDIVSQIRTGNDTDKVHIGDRAMLGIQAQATDSTSVTSGALVAGVQDNTGASAAGLKENDVIVSIDGKTIATDDALRDALSHLHPGDSVDVGWVDSAGTHHDASIKLVVGPPL